MGGELGLGKIKTAEIIIFPAREFKKEITSQLTLRNENGECLHLMFNNDCTEALQKALSDIKTW